MGSYDGFTQNLGLECGISSLKLVNWLGLEVKIIVWWQQDQKITYCMELLSVTSQNSGFNNCHMSALKGFDYCCMSALKIGKLVGT